MSDKEATAPREPKTYRALQNGYVDDRYVYEGETFTTSAPQGSWMEDLDPGAEPEARKPVRSTPAPTE